MDITYIIDELNSLRRGHYYCEDTWYSCPMHPEGCADDNRELECDCGADEVNKDIDNLMKYIIHNWRLHDR